jgi:hypothetical protein
MKVKLRPEARQDIYEASLFYDLQSDGLGDHFIKCIFEDLQRLELFAGIHSKRSNYYRILSQKFPFIICYELSDNRIEVIAILSCRMRPERIDSVISRR